MASQERNSELLRTALVRINSILASPLNGASYLQPSLTRLNCARTQNTTAQFVAVHGDEYEPSVAIREAKNPNYCFLRKDDPLNPYYRHKVSTIQLAIFVNYLRPLRCRERHSWLISAPYKRHSCVTASARHALPRAACSHSDAPSLNGLDSLACRWSRSAPCWKAKSHRRSRRSLRTRPCSLGLPLRTQRFKL